MDIWNLIYVVGCIFGGYLTFVQILDKIKRTHAEDRIQDSKQNADLELKVKELEGKIGAQYSELSAKLANVERALNEDKQSKLTFESRVLSLLDKTDTKMERLQDMLLKSFVKNNLEQ